MGWQSNGGQSEVGRSPPSPVRLLLLLLDVAGASSAVQTGTNTNTSPPSLQAINKSLSALGDVIAALGNKEAHVPYRNSKLTFLLQNSLGGEAALLWRACLLRRCSNCSNELTPPLNSASPCTWEAVGHSCSGTCRSVHLLPPLPAGSNSKTLMFVNIAPSAESAQVGSWAVFGAAGAAAVLHVVQFARHLLRCCCEPALLCP